LSRDTKFAHHLLEQLVLGPQNVIGSDPLRQLEKLGV